MIEKPNEGSLADNMEDDGSTVSSMLIAARNEMGLSQKDVARELYLTVKFIRFIDAGELSEIPKQAFVRGYLRTYAKLVKLDGDLIVQKYNRSIAGPTEPFEVRGLSSASVGSINFTGPVFKTGLFGLAGLVLIIIIVWLQSSGDEQPAPIKDVVQDVIKDSVKNAPTDAAQDGSDKNNVRVIERPSPGKPFAGGVSSGLDTADVIPDAVEQVDGTTDDPITESDFSAAAEPDDFVPFGLSAEEAESEDEPVTGGAEEANLQNIPLVDDPISIDRDRVGDTNFIVVRAHGDDELIFAFNDECWLEIQDGNGKAIFGDLGRAGDELTVYGVAPFEVLFGKAPAVTMAFNGVSIDLSRSTASDDTAKVIVGD